MQTCSPLNVKQPTKGSIDLSDRSLVFLTPAREGAYAGGVSIACAIPAIGGTNTNR